MRSTFRVNDKGDEPRFEEAILHECGEMGLSAANFARYCMRKVLKLKSYDIPPIGPERRGRPRNDQVHIEVPSSAQKKTLAPALFSQAHSQGDL